ncbi:hypothetical protein NDI39_10000 [Microcoleus sp. ZQ-A2]|nr:hypothetical protein [Microcoleus sp. FACHB-1]
MADIKGWINGFVHDCWVTAKIRSLPEVKLPLFGNEDTPTDQLNKTLLYEWGTDRLELEILLGDGLGNWGSFGETAIKNSNGYRYRKHRALDLMTDQSGFQLEENFKIGARLINVGFGDLTRADKVDILGSWTQEFVTIQPQPVYVTNNVYGGTGTAPTTPVSNAVLSLTLSSGTSALIGSGTPINIALTKATASKSFTATWRREGTLTTLSGTLSTDANGNASLTYDSSNFSVLGGGKYSLEITDNGKAILSNELNAVMPSVVVSPASAYNWSSSTISVAVSGLSIGTTYTLGFIGITSTNVSRTQSADVTTFTFPGTTFSNPGTYKARLTKGNTIVESNDVVISTAPTFTLTTTRSNSQYSSTVPFVGYYAEDTPLTFRAANLPRSAAFNFSWVKNNVVAASGTGNTDANGVWEGTFGCTILQNAPYGEGVYRLRLTMADIDISSNLVDIRSLKYRTQPTANQVMYTSQGIDFDVVGIPLGATFTYTILKGGAVQGSPVSQTFAYVDTNFLYHRFSLNSTTTFNNYGAGNNYSVRVNYNNREIVSNTFSIQQAPPQALG